MTAEDIFGNLTTGYTGTVHFVTTDARGTVPADYTFTGTDAGVHTFTSGATFITAGTQSITATDTVTSSVTCSQTVTVQAAAAATMTLSGYPTSTVAGVAHTMTTTLFDAFGNVATGYRGTVHFTSTDAQAGLPANYVYTSTDAGTHTFTLT